MKLAIGNGSGGGTTGSGSATGWPAVGLTWLAEVDGTAIRVRAAVGRAAAGFREAPA